MVEDGERRWGVMIGLKDGLGRPGGTEHLEPHPACRVTQMPGERLQNFLPLSPATFTTPHHPPPSLTVLFTPP